ncbi:MAG: FAD-dependent oxidoreductase [Legionellales bacterium]
MTHSQVIDTNQQIIIIGAGISGLALAILLSRNGHTVSVYEKRAYFAKEIDGRSINFTISGRGLNVLDKLGLKNKVVAHSVALQGREVHLKQSKTIHYKYGTQKENLLHAIRRSALIDILLNEVALETNIKIHYGCELTHIDKATLKCDFFDQKTQSTLADHASCVIGADGVFSAVRGLMMKEQITSYQQKVFDWGYKEFNLNEHDGKTLQLDANKLHMWPNANALLVAIPNTDKSFSVILTAPLSDACGNRTDFNQLIKDEYADLVSHAPGLLDKQDSRLSSYLVSVKIDRWHLDDKIVLLGDACHATYPFYGQGMNSSLEDALILSDHIHHTSLSRKEAFIRYEKTRKTDTNALHQLSEAHLHRMTKAMISPFWQAKDTLDYYLAKVFSKQWFYEYEAVAHSNISYLDVLNMVKKQNKRKLFSGFFIIAYLLGIRTWSLNKINKIVN